MAGGVANLRSFCTNSAIATDAAGTNIILRNAAPGQLGSLGLRPIYGPDYYAAFIIDPDGYRIEAYYGPGET